jgi:glycosyltransferase involved in cell wall biosynthesis
MHAAATSPSVSVALCTYNGERFVRSQLESVLGQSYPVTEVVIGDDGSSDRTVDIIRETVAAGDAQGTVRIAFTDRVGGVVPNFERTLRACTGSLIALSDQDDVWHPDRILRAVERFEARPSLDFLASDAAIIDDEGVRTGATLWGHLCVSPDELGRIADGRGFEVLIKRNVVTGATGMLRREFLEAALPLPSSWIHDEWLAILAASRGGFDVIPEQLIDYRVHGGNQIGVAAPTLRRRVAHVFAPRGDRLDWLADRADRLVDTIGAIGVAAEVVELARLKQTFERRRSLYPASRLRRWGPVAVNAKKGNYRRLSSQGNLDVIRDLAQPASAG